MPSQIVQPDLGTQFSTAISETRWLQTSVFCLLVFVWSLTSVPRRRHTSGLRKSSTAATLFHRKIVCRSTHTQHIRPTCATRTLRTAVSGVNSKRFVLMLLPGRN